MKISLTFLNDKTTIQLMAESDAERRVLALIREYDDLKLESVKEDDSYALMSRPFNTPPVALVLSLVKPAPNQEPGEVG